MPFAGYGASARRSLALALAPAVMTRKAVSESARHSEIGLDAAALVQPLRVDDLRPGSTATSFAQIRCSTASASRPSTRNLAKEVMSNSPTESRTALCSAALVLEPVLSLPIYICRTARRLRAQTSSARSQPATSPKQAPAAASRSCKGDGRMPRAVAACRIGKMIA